MRVQWVPLVGVDDHHKEARISVDHLRLVARLQVPEDGGIVEEGQVDHVLALLEFGRVDATNISGLKPGYIQFEIQSLQQYSTYVNFS